MNFLNRLIRLHTSSVPVEDFFTEVLAGLFRYRPEVLFLWLDKSGALGDADVNEFAVDVSTQVGFSALKDHSMSSRPDMVVRLRDREGSNHIVFVESKIGSGEGADQLSRYAEHLSEVVAITRTLAYVTRDYDPKDEATVLKKAPDVKFVPSRWSDLYLIMQELLRTSVFLPSRSGRLRVLIL